MSAYDLLPCTHRSHVSNDDCYYAHKRLALEEKIVRKLIRDMKQEGWTPGWVYTDEQEKVSTETQTLDAVCSVDESTITFVKGPASKQNRHGVLLVKGNGVDVICDWDFSEGDEDGFSAAMDRVTDAIMEQYDH